MTVSVVAFIGRHSDKARVRQAIAALPDLGDSRFAGWFDAKPAGEACLAATRAAIKRAQKGEHVLLVGLRTLVVPPGSQDLDAEGWYAAWVHLVARHAMAWLLPADGGALVSVTTAAKASTIRQYQRAEQALSRVVQVPAATSESHICGRPPYGYRVVDGHLAAQPKQQEAVKRAFYMAQQGATLREIVTDLQSNHAKGPDRKRQFWDRVKLKRIWSHVSLYVRGRYQTAGGPVVHLPQLAFLEEAYEGVPYPSPPVRAAAAMADIPSRPGKGKMEAHASSTSRRKSS